MAKNELMVQSISPGGKLEAFVELTEDVAYFYVRNLVNRQPLRSCWVRNLSPAPQELDLDCMRDGRSPMLPADCVLDAEARPIPNDGDLKVVWFEEENGASLLENDTVLCVIPPNSGCDGFEGYAAECGRRSALCWPLAEEADVLRRVERDRAFWDSWEGADDTPYDHVRKQAIATVMRNLGVEPSVFATDVDEWPPKGIVKAVGDNVSVLLTIGGSVRRQPGIGDDPGSAPHRFELAACYPNDADESVETVLSNFMVSLMEYPWDRGASLVDGELVRFTEFVGACESVEGVILSKDYPQAPQLDLGRMGGEPVEIYWLIPITTNEWAFANAQGGIELVAQLVENGVGHVVTSRATVV